MAATERSVLIPVDASEHSLRAFHWFLENLWKPTDMVYLVHCMEPPSLSSFSLKNPMNIPTQQWEEAIKSQITAGQKIENQFTSECVEKHVKHFEVHTIQGKNTGETIMSFVEEKHIMMIVIGNRGLGKYRRTFLGSVSDFIVHHAHIPVTIVPPQKS